MKTLYLHIGSPKTGTTALQLGFAKGRDTLANCSIHYVYADDVGRGTGHQNLGKSFVDNPYASMRPAQNPDAIRRAVLDEIRTCRTDIAVLSSEKFSTANVAHVREYFDDLRDTWQIKIILFVRSQDEHAESLFNQAVKRLSETRPFGDYIQSIDKYLNIAVIADRWAAQFGKDHIICGVYDAATRDVMSQFFSCIEGLPASARDKLSGLGREQVHASMNLQQLVAQLSVNRAAAAERLPQTAIGIKAQNQKKTGHDAEHKTSERPALFFDSQQARAFRSQYGKINRDFTDRYLGQARDDLGGRRYSDTERDGIIQAIQRTAQVPHGHQQSADANFLPNHKMVT